MIDSENLRTASLYINNQLLSRGLLRDGHTINFDRPGDDDYELAETMGRVMSVVNDLILRRDRDADHRETLSHTLRTLRADSLRQTNHLTRLQDALADSQRKVALADAQAAALTAQLKTADATIHKLKDDAVRTKKLVADTRAACATDVRRRDRQNDGLKKAVAEAGRARGERKSAGITTIHVTGEVGGEEDVAGVKAEVMDEEYDLRQETNAFLSQLAKGLNEENETVLAVIRKTFASLKEMSGWGKDDDGEGGAAAAAAKADGLAITLSENPEDMLPDLEGVLSHLRTMLSNPAFVPIEELEVRDEEIFRLREGWVKMEVRWEEAVRLIDSWRRRMAADGRPVDMEELKMGLRLSPVRVKGVAETAPVQGEYTKLSTLLEEEEEEEEKEEQDVDEDEDEEVSSFAQRQDSPSPPESLHLVPADDYQGDMAPEYEDDQAILGDSDTESSIFHDDVDGDMDLEDMEEIQPNIEILQQSGDSAMDDSPSTILPPPPKITPLEESSLAGNRKPHQEKTMEKSRKRSGHLIEDSASLTEESSRGTGNSTLAGQSPQKRLKTSIDSDTSLKPRQDSGIFTNSNSSQDSVALLLEPSPPPATTLSKATSKTTTTRATRSASAKKPSPAPAKPATTKTTRAAAVQEKKKEPPTKPLARQRPTRATAPTASSSTRTSARSKPEPQLARPRAAAAAQGLMAPPPRPSRTNSSNSTNSTNSPATQAQPSVTAKAEKKSSPPDSTQSTQRIPAEKTTTTTTVPSTSITTTDSPLRPTPSKSVSRLPRSKHLLPAPVPQSPITVAGIAAKLAASEREANAARVRAKLKAARLSKNNNNNGSVAGDPVKPLRSRFPSAATTTSTESVDENGRAGGVSVGGVSGGAPEDEEEEQQQQAVSRSARDFSAPTNSPDKLSPAKRRRPAGYVREEDEKEKEVAGMGTPAAAAGKRKREVRTRAARVASRRRSTLSPWELQSLIAGGVTPGRGGEAAGEGNE